VFWVQIPASPFTMNSLYLKIIVILLIIIGEGFAIFAEMMAARNHTGSLITQTFLKMFLVFIIAAGFLLTGYVLGYSVFKNIWIVSVASITSILIIEPILAYTIFSQLPTKGALIGLILGALGFISALVF
jgi:hypothetical protein